MRERAVNGVLGQQIIINRQKRYLSDWAGQEGRDIKRAQKLAQNTIGEAMETMKDFQQLVKDLDTKWKTPQSRNVGHIVYSPPISTGEKPNDYTMDWGSTHQKSRIFQETSLNSGTRYQTRSSLKS